MALSRGTVWRLEPPGEVQGVVSTLGRLLLVALLAGWSAAMTATIDPLGGRS